ncbi:MAG: hypothetical protein AAF616_14105 [Bacteroidota bacterium]
MNSFEEVSKHLLEIDGYWVKASVRVDISPEDKKRLEKPSMPRPEIDLVAFKPLENTLFLIECKSYFDSAGVVYENLYTRNLEKDRYKILTWGEYQKVVSETLKLDFVDHGLINSSTKIGFGLIAGKIKNGDEESIRKLAKERDWKFWGPNELYKLAKKMSRDGYADNPYHILAKIIFRHKSSD